MIGRLRGELVSKQPPHLLLDVSGVGYELQAPMSTFYSLPRVGESVTLVTHLAVRDDAHMLYAFASEVERSLFRSLLRVNGVGAKMALAILSGMDARAFSVCVRDGDSAALVRLPGVGRKTAERLIIEMRDRLDGFEVADTGFAPPSPSQRPPSSPVEDAVRALIALGYKPQEASRMISKVNVQEQTSEDIIRLALKASLA
ncbi:MAG: Holliday junction branch migration protein RuvA [Gammaproteobacteria bacterium]